jgi:hypothetical protein
MSNVCAEFSNITLWIVLVLPIFMHMYVHYVNGKIQDLGWQLANERQKRAWTKETLARTVTKSNELLADTVREANKKIAICKEFLDLQRQLNAIASPSAASNRTDSKTPS